MILRFTAALLAAIFFSAGIADAKPRHKHYKRHHIQRDVGPVVAVNECNNEGRCIVVRSTEQHIRKVDRLIRDGARAVTSYLPHPSGCPRTAFCACGAAVEVFGTPRRDLWPARAWYRFPAASPGYKMVAVRNHHVFVLREQVQGTIWKVADYNSGGHQSQLHERDIRGYKIVNPHGSYAQR